MGGICCGPSKKPVTPLPSQTSIRPSTVEDVKSRTPSPSIQREYSSDSPFSNTGMSKSDPLNLIQGYENEPLVSLEEALGPFHGKIIDLSDYIKEAKTKCYYPEKPKLTLDESAAIYIYTMKWGDGCLYNHLQDAWKSDDPLELKPWLKYLKLFKNAFDKLPDAKGEIWQGKLFDDRLEEEITLNSSSLYMAMDIFSPSKTVVEETLDSQNVEKKILIGFNSVGGKWANSYAADGSNEILVFPGTKVGISEVMSDNFSVIYHVTGPTPPRPRTKTPRTETPRTKTPRTKTPQTITPQTKTPQTITPQTKTPQNITPQTITPIKIEKHFQCLNDRCDHEHYSSVILSCFLLHIFICIIR